MKKLENILQNIGLSDSECSVLSKLIIHGDTTVNYLAKHTGLPRQTIYSILERLGHSGLIAASDRSGVRRFSSTIDMVESHFKKQAQLFEVSQKQLVELAPVIEEALQTHRGDLPQAKYFTGELGVEYLLDSVLKDLAEPKSKKRFQGFGVNSYEETGMRKAVEIFVKKRAKLGVSTQLIVSNKDDDFGVTGAADPLRREVKKIDIEEGRAGCYIVDDKVYLFSFQDRAGIRIQHPGIADLLSNVFDYIWKDK